MGNPKGHRGHLKSMGIEQFLDTNWGEAGGYKEFRSRLHQSDTLIAEYFASKYPDRTLTRQAIGPWRKQYNDEFGE